MWKRVLVVISFAFILAACQSENAALPSTLMPSTPIRDLPISNQTIRQDDALPTPVSDALIAEADAEYLLLTNIYERVTPSIVNIEVVVNVAGQRGFVDVGRGSGFIYDRNGHIITNAHVVNNADEIRVTFNDGYVTEAELVGQDVFSDLAVIKVETSSDRLLPLSLADSDNVRVGERAIAIGNPFGLSSSMTVGIVSGLGRQLASAELIDSTVIPGFQNPSIIQVDTDVNPGNSGGPLLNSHGDVIGVNTAIRTDSGIFEGVAFAVPANTVNRVIPELIADGRVDYSWLGITTVSADDGLGVAALAEPLELPVTAGVLVTGVSGNSPAQKAGLQGGTRVRTIRDRDICVGGDIIIAIDDQFVDNMDELVAYLVINTHPGDTVNLLIVRADETFEVPLTLESRPTSNQDIIPFCGDV
jgi:S1-C subfamily serine protease